MNHASLIRVHGSHIDFVRGCRLLRHHWPALNAPQQSAIASRLEQLVDGSRSHGRP